MPNQAPSQQSGFSQMTMRQRREIIVGLLYYPALTLQTFIRRKSGFRHLKPGRIIGMTVIMLLVAYVAGHVPATSFNPFRPAPSVSPAVSTVQPSSNIPDGLDAPLPGNWGRMDAISRYQWVHKHQLTPQQLEQRHAREAAQAQQQTAAIQPNAPQGGMSRALMLFALLFCAWGLIQRRLRWWDICRGVRWHTLSRGVSFLVPVLGHVMKEPNIMRFIDPLLCFTVGCVFYRFSHALGLWVMFSAFALYVVEQAVYERELDMLLDQLDVLVYSEVLGENARHFVIGEAQEQQAQQPMEETAGIATGLTPDIEAQIEARRARQKSKQHPPPSPELIQAMRERIQENAQAPIPPGLAGDVVPEETVQGETLL